jgi:hypothetical protein
MADRALFVGFGEPVRGREERAVEVFGEWVAMLGRMQGDGRIAGMEPCLLAAHGGDLGGFFMIRGSDEQMAALPEDMEFRRAVIDATLIVENFGYIRAVAGAAVGEEMGMYAEAVAKVGGGAKPAAATAAASVGHNGG